MDPIAELLAQGIFWHECVIPGCTHQVQFDDEPWCFTHSPDEGSSKIGYSAHAESLKK